MRSAPGNEGNWKMTKLGGRNGDRFYVQVRPQNQCSNKKI